jgi:hypothetical protein
MIYTGRITAGVLIRCEKSLRLVSYSVTARKRKPLRRQIPLRTLLSGAKPRSAFALLAKFYRYVTVTLYGTALKIPTSVSAAPLKIFPFNRTVVALPIPPPGVAAFVTKADMSVVRLLL